MLEVRQRRPPLIFSDGVPRAAPGRAIHGEEAIELIASRVAQSMSDAPVEAPVDLGPATPRLLEQGREPGQLEAVADEFLDGNVHDVGQVVLRLCRLAHDRGHEGVRLAVEGPDIEERADDGNVPTSRAGFANTEQALGSIIVAQAHGDVPDDRCRDVAGQHEVAEPLEGLQKDKEAHPPRRSGSWSSWPGRVLQRLARVDLREFGRRHALFSRG